MLDENVLDNGNTHLDYTETLAGKASRFLCIGIYSLFFFIGIKNLFTGNVIYGLAILLTFGSLIFISLEVGRKALEKQLIAQYHDQKKKDPTKELKGLLKSLPVNNGQRAAFSFLIGLVGVIFIAGFSPDDQTQASKPEPMQKVEETKSDLSKKEEISTFDLNYDEFKVRVKNSLANSKSVYNFSNVEENSTEGPVRDSKALLFGNGELGVLVFLDKTSNRVAEVLIMFQTGPEQSTKAIHKILASKDIMSVMAPDNQIDEAAGEVFIQFSEAIKELKKEPDQTVKRKFVVANVQYAIMIDDVVGIVVSATPIS